MTNCSNCIHSNNGICQNDNCLIDIKDNCYGFESSTTYKALISRTEQPNIEDSYSEYIQLADELVKKIRADAIDDCIKLCESIGNNTYFTDDWLRNFKNKLEQLKEKENDRL